MLKTLLMLRLRALAAGFTKRRDGKKSGVGTHIFVAVMMIYCLGAFGFMFGGIFYAVRAPFQALGMTWLYYALAVLLASALCFIGSIFYAQSMLYEARDNELLLSMPVPPAVILLSRMLTLYLLNLAYTLIIMAPCGIVACLDGGVTAGGVIRFVLLTLLLPLLPTTLSCALGGLIALATARMRSKNLFNLVLSLALLGGYMMVCFNLEGYIQRLVENGAALGAAVQRAMPPFYSMGLALAGGQWRDCVAAVLWCVVPFAFVYLLLTVSFYRIATQKRGQGKIRYRERALHASPARRALLKKELRRFTSSVPYMMNGGIGLLLAIIFGVMAHVRGGALQSVMDATEGAMTSLLAPIVCALLCMMEGMTIISAPSLSLEGKSFWIVQSAPVRARDVLLAKAFAHIALSAPLGLIASLLFATALPLSGLDMLFVFLLPALMSALMGLLGVAVNLRWPRFDYASESAAIKQSMSTTVTMFSGMGIVALPVLLYALWLHSFLSPAALLSLCALLMLAGCAALSRYLTHGAEKAFAAL